MQIDEAELNARLEEAVRIRALLRRATREWGELGKTLLEQRDRNGPERSDDGGTSSGKET